MLNFAEQTGSGAVIVVWSFLTKTPTIKVLNTVAYELVRGRKQE